MTWRQIFYRGIIGAIVAGIRWLIWFFSLKAEKKWLARGVYVDRSSYILL